MPRVLERDGAFTLIEIMVAITVVVIGVAGIYGLTPHIIQTVSYNYNRFVAAQLASEAIEIVRNIRDSNWLEGGANAWYEGLQPNCQAICCEVDYNALTQQDPVLTAVAGTAPSCGDIGDFSAANYLKIGANGYSYSGADQTVFKRLLSITPELNGGGEIYKLIVEVTVFWGGGDKSLTISEEFYNWR